jgi:hypothetical protein
VGTFQLKPDIRYVSDRRGTAVTIAGVGLGVNTVSSFRDGRWSETVPG